MASYNRIVMIGNLTRDPEYKQLTSGQPVCRLGLAVNRQYKNKQTGLMVQEVCFIDVDVFGPQADSCRQYLQKGRAVLIEGRLKLDTWQAPDGQNRSKHSIVADRVVFLSSASGVEVEGAQVDADAPDLGKEILSRVQGAKKVNESDLPGKSGPMADAGELTFKDEPPFQDDLPF